MRVASWSAARVLARAGRGGDGSKCASEQTHGREREDDGQWDFGGAVTRVFAAVESLFAA